MKRATLVLLALLLVPAAQADAKFSSARVCGPSDCRQVVHGANDTLATMMKAAFSTRSRFASEPPEASPWYRVTFCPGRCKSRYALSLKVLPTTGYQYVTRTEHGARRGWATLDQHTADIYRRVTRRLEPFPASRLIALGATDPNSGPGDAQGGFPTWAWIPIAAAAVVLVPPTLRRLRRSQRPQSVG